MYLASGLYGFQICKPAILPAWYLEPRSRSGCQIYAVCPHGSLEDCRGFPQALIRLAKRKWDAEQQADWFARPKILAQSAIDGADSTSHFVGQCGDSGDRVLLGKAPQLAFSAFLLRSLVAFFEPIERDRFTVSLAIHSKTNAIDSNLFPPVWWFVPRSTMDNPWFRIFSAIFAIALTNGATTLEVNEAHRAIPLEHSMANARFLTLFRRIITRKMCI